MRRSENMQQRRHRQMGMTVLELIIAMVVLALGILGTMPVLVVAINSNFRNRQVSNSTALAQMVTEKITSVGSRSTLPIDIKDGAGTDHSIGTDAGGSTTADTPNYFMLYTDAGTAGRQAVYDVRWIITKVGDTKQLTVWAKLAGGVAPPVTVRTIIGP